MESYKEEQDAGRRQEQQLRIAHSIKRSIEYNRILGSMINQGDSVADVSVRMLKEWPTTPKSVYQPTQHFNNDNQSEIEVIFKRFYLNQFIESISDQNSLCEAKVKWIWNMLN